MVDFQKKIKFLLENLYNNELNRLTEAFIKYKYPTPKQLRSRKVAIRKWLDEKKKIKSPYMFDKDYDKYAISQLKFKDGTQVFPLYIFDLSFDKFQARFEKYQNDKKSKHLSLEDYRYIYYYHKDSKSLVYFEITYENNSRIKLSTYNHTQIITYTGEVVRHSSSSMLNFIVSNELERMFFSFSELDLRLDFDVYGLCLSKDFLLKNPKSSLVLLSQNLLGVQRKKLFETKINTSNITIVDNDKRTEEKSFIDNLSTHLRDLKSCTDSYFSRNIFLNLFLEEFNLFYQKLDNFERKDEFFINSLVKNLYIILDSLKQSKKREHLKIIYTIKDINKSLFSSVDNQAIEIYNYILTLSKQGIISFEFIISLGKKVKIDKELEFIFKEFEQADIRILFRDYRDMKAYTTIILINDYNLAISCRNGYYSHNITRSKKKVNDLRREYEIQKHYAKPLQTILDRDYPLNGIWYFYGYGSSGDLHFATMLIDGDRVDITLNSHNNRKYRGKKYEIYGDILLCTELGIIKFREEVTEFIKVVSILSNQHYGYGKPVVLFGILSRVKLEEEDINTIFSILVDKDISNYEKASFSISMNIDAILKPLLLKYEDIYNSTIK